MGDIYHYLHLWELFQLKYSIIHSSYFNDEENYTVNFFGNKNIIFSAPHSVSHKRNEKIKSAEIGTAGLAEVLAMINESVSICTLSCKNSDPNWDEEEKLYKKEIKNLACSFNNNFMLIDIHGCKDDYGFDINFGLGISPNQKVKELIERSLSVAREYNLVVNVDNVFNAKKKTTITSFAQSLGGSAVQIEIARRYRMPNEEREMALRLLSFLKDSITNA